MKKLLATTALITLLASSAFATNLNSNNTNNNPIANGGNARKVKLESTLLKMIF
jgi:hypothetical protein